MQDAPSAPAGAIITTNGPPGILPHHLAGLRARGLTDATIIAAGITSETSAEKIGTLLRWKYPAKKIVPAILIPFHGPDGSNGYYRVRPDVPRECKKKPVKYESPRGEPNRVYFPPGVAEHLPNPAQEMAITEGEFKALALTQELLPTLGLVGIGGWKERDHQRLLPELESIAWQGRTVYLVPDSDVAKNKSVETAVAWLAKHLTDRGANVRFVRIPDGPNGAKQGIDDFIAKGADAKREVRAMLDSADDPPVVKPDEIREPASAADPADEAAAILAAEQRDGVSRLRYWRDTFMHWRSGRYVEIKASEVSARIVQHLNRNYHHVGTTIVNNVVLQLKGQSLLPGDVNVPAWLAPVDGYEEWQPADLLVARNGIVHLPSNTKIDPTPRLFTPAALDFDYNAEAPEPTAWIKFLTQDLWPNDAESVLTLQQWFGLCLVADTRHQKMLLIVGPKRSGKGTIARVLRNVVGEANCAGPTMASLGTNFGLWPLWGKSVAIISDARLSGRTDQAVITERLLSITGEDALTIDRKHQEPVTDKLIARMMILTNELPRLGDSSGALSGRMLILRLANSFYGKEEIGLTDRLLAERAGILNWAIKGWRSLRDKGHFIQPKASDDLRDQLDELASPVTAFANETCIIDEGHRLHRVPCKSLFAAWCAWCIAKGLKPTSDAHFGRDLTAAFPNVRKIRTREISARNWVYDGIALLSLQPDEFPG